MSTAILTVGAEGPNAKTACEPIETDEALYEVINGQRVELPPMSVWAVTIATRLTGRLNAFARPAHLGEAFMEMLIVVPAPDDEERNRRPDVCFVSSSRLGRFSPEDLDAAAWDVVPELLVEVTSPTDRAEAQRQKVVEYFQLGARCVWVVYPRLGLIDVYEGPANCRTFGPGDVLPGDPVLPGLELRLADIFSPMGSAEVQ
jgi:Uma2 family endonuclease